MTAAQRYRKKPVVIEAMQYDGSNAEVVAQWIDDCTGEFSPAYVYGDEFGIRTLEGDLTVSSGDWVIKGVQGEFYPCKPDIFAATYEPADRPLQGVRQHDGIAGLVRDVADDPGRC